jgi:hypothetical protein
MDLQFILGKIKVFRIHSSFQIQKLILYQSLEKLNQQTHVIRTICLWESVNEKYSKRNLCQINFGKTIGDTEPKNIYVRPVLF